MTRSEDDPTQAEYEKVSEKAASEAQAHLDKLREVPGVKSNTSILEPIPPIAERETIGEVFTHAGPQPVFKAPPDPRTYKRGGPPRSRPAVPLAEIGKQVEDAAAMLTEAATEERVREHVGGLSEETLNRVDPFFSKQLAMSEAKREHLIKVLRTIRALQRLQPESDELGDVVDAFNLVWQRRLRISPSQTYWTERDVLVLASVLANLEGL